MKIIDTLSHLECNLSRSIRLLSDLAEAIYTSHTLNDVLVEGDDGRAPVRISDEFDLMVFELMGISRRINHHTKNWRNMHEESPHV